MDERVPAYLRAELETAYGRELYDEIEAGWRASRPVTLRINTLKSSRSEVTDALQAAGIACRDVAWYEDALILEGIREAEVENLSIYAEGKVYLQSLSAMIPPLVLKPGAGESVLDMAAAPGGKTTMMAALSGGRAQITACERDAGRCERLRYNLRRQGVQALVMQKDARDLDDFFRFDRILLDAPCTGSGTLDLTEGAKARRMTPDWVRKTVKTQKALMTKAARMLKAGGHLVYATCSILPVENEEVVTQILSGGDMELLPVEECLATAFPTLPARLPGTLVIRPDALFEGFYVAHLRRKG